MEINVNCHSSIQIKNIYIDPYKIESENHNAKYIFITHTHYDHMSLEDIDKIIKKDTILIAPMNARKTLENYYPNKIIFVKPGENISLDDMEVEVLYSYNINKLYHKKIDGFVGYKLILNGITYAIVGDTDNIPELKNLTCDVLFVPIGGTYTMDATEAAEFTNIVFPKIVIPVHYNLIVGTKKDEQIFSKNVNKNIQIKFCI